MKIYVCDVNYGECILYSEHRRLLVVDCGARFAQQTRHAGRIARQAFQRGLAQLERRAPLREKALLLTHLDSSHFNGLLELPTELTFRRIYLPYYSYQREADGRYSVGGIFYRLCWCAAFGALTGHPERLNQLKSLLCTLPARLDEGGVIHCVCRQDFIDGAGTEFEVLWPQRNSALLHSEPLVEMQRSVLHRAVRRLRRTEEETALLTAVENCAYALMQLYHFYAGADRRDGCRPARPELAERFSALQKQVGEAVENLLSLPIVPLTRGEAGRSGYVTRELMREMNGSSVVFHKPEILLSSGDIPPEVVQYLDGMNLLCPHYRIIKLPCHGTENGYTPRLPKAETAIVSNGGDNRSDWKISTRYRDHDIGTMCCTNTNGHRCELYSGGMPEQCVNCQIWPGGRDRCLLLSRSGDVKFKK